MANNLTALSNYVTKDDHELTHKEFLFCVATRILDELGILHNLESINPNFYPREIG